MRVIARLLSVLALSVVVSPAVSAQGTSPAPAPSPAAPATIASAPAAAHKPWVVGLTGDFMSVAPAAASTQMIGAHSFGMQIDAGVTFASFLYAGLDFAPQFVSDKASFTQSTTGAT